MVPCEPDMINLIATDMMLLGYLCCVASTTLSRQLGTTTIIYVLP